MSSSMSINTLKYTQAYEDTMPQTKEEQLARARELYHLNGDRRRARQRELYHLNREHKLKMMKDYREKHPDKVKKWNHDRYMKGKHKVAIFRQELLNTRFGGKCKQCGFTDWRALQIDHIHGNGYEDKRGRGIEYIKRLLKMDDAELHSKYQLLCANCNWIKKYENNEVTRRRY
ncbi:hypothetical protein ES703_118266 [subsurface metagenome]